MRMVCYDDEADSFDFRWRSEPPAFPASKDVASALPRFESMALLAGESPPKAGDLLGILLGSTFPVDGHGSRVLRPLWAEEAMHRAYGFVRLVDARNRRRVSADETAIARDLAARFRELEAVDEREEQPSTAVLRDVVAGLGSLFGGPANITLKTAVEHVSLPAYKRRALVAAAAELVSNALLHAFNGREAGMIDVGLTAHGPEFACLRVADNGTGFADRAPNLARGVAAGFAGLLEADLTYDRRAGWTIAEIAFPISGC
jgi:two-component sensor histidine kinase